MQADATVAPTCIDIIYILHVYLSLCVITIYCRCASTNKYCLLSIVYICQLSRSDMVVNKQYRLYT